MTKFWQAIKKTDKILLISMIVLIVISLTVLYSVHLSDDIKGELLLGRQVLFVFLGMSAFSFFLIIDYRWWQPFYPWFYVISFILLLLIFSPLGEVIRGVRGWIDFGFFVWQPVELVKLLLVLSLAGYFSKQGRHIYTWRPLFVTGTAMLLLGLLVMVQPDLGSAFILFILWLGLVLLLGLSKWQISAMLIVFISVAFLGWSLVLRDYQKQRVISFMDPTSDPLGSGYNLTQALIAIGSGGFFGRGIGVGSQSQLQFLPERHTDFVFAVIGEELGFAGVLLVLTLYGLIAWRMIVIAKNTSSDFGQIVTIGILLMIVGQAIVNIAMNLGLVPVTGLSLPLISSGGSYLVVVLMMLGVVQSIKIHS